MKKHIMSALIITVILSLFFTLPISVAAQEYGYYTFEISDKKATITEVDKNISGSINVPSHLGGYPVTSISINAFGNCDKITKISLPDSLTNIGPLAFFGCTKLSDIRIPENVKKIGISAFDGCESLRSITIPDSVTTIGEWAFDGCSNLISVIISSGVKSIGGLAFDNCPKLKSITVTESNDWYSSENGILFNKSKSEIIRYPAAKTATSYTLPDSVTNVYYASFSRCKNLKTVKLSRNLISIGARAFERCSNLTDITIPGSVTSIEYKAFYGCKKLKDVYYSSSEEKWLTTEFTYDNEQLTEANIHYNSCMHSYVKKIIKATPTANGKIVTSCTDCADISKSTTIYAPSHIRLSRTEYTYNGNVQKPTVTIKDSNGKKLKKGTDYVLKYESGRKLPGRYTVTITFKGKYAGTKKLVFTIIPKETRKITATQTTTAVTLNWNKVTGADGYRIYQYNTKTKKYEKVKDVTGTSLKITDLKSGTKYKFKVRAYTKDDGTIMGAYSSVFETATKAKTPTLKATSTKKGAASLSWTNVTGESGYQVYYATKKNGEYKKLDSYKVNVVKATASKLTSGKTYYFKVRAYTKTDSGTVYSAWSTVKSVTIK